MHAVQFRTSVFCRRLQKGLIKPVVWSERETRLKLPQADCLRFVLAAVNPH